MWITMTRLSFLTVVSCLIVSISSAHDSLTIWGVVPRGGDSSFASACEDVKSTIIEKANKQVNFLLE